MQQTFELNLDFNDVLIQPERSTLRSRGEVELEREFTFIHHDNYTWKGIPIMASNMDSTGTFEMAVALAKHKMLTCIHKFYNLDDWKNAIDSEWFANEYMIPSIGAQDSDFQKFEEIYNYSKQKNKQIRFICIDVANGYGQYLVDFISKVRQKMPEVVIIAGNVVTKNITEELLLKGASIIKVGIGSGSACTTRIKTGVGRPQLSAIIECANAAHGIEIKHSTKGGTIISDGGCTCAGDVAKAFAAGSDFVMLGGMLAGHDQSGGEIITEYHKTGLLEKNENGDFKDLIKEKKYKIFYGMSSDTAMNKYYGGVNNYRTSEGRTVKIEYKGDVENTIQDILGGLRSTCTYVGSSRLKDLTKRTTFIKVNNQYNKVFENKTI